MDRLDRSVRGQPATQWRGVSPTTKGRRERLSQNTVTGPMRQGGGNQFVGSIGTCQCVSRSLRSGGNLFLPTASTIRDGPGSIVMDR